MTFLLTNAKYIEKLLQEGIASVTQQNWLHDCTNVMRFEDSQAFDVNVCTIMAMKQIGKGRTALNNSWEVMNIPHRGLHHKTFQKHLKGTFREPEATTLDKLCLFCCSSDYCIYKKRTPAFARTSP